MRAGRPASDGRSSMQFVEDTLKFPNQGGDWNTMLSLSHDSLYPQGTHAIIKVIVILLHVSHDENPLSSQNLRKVNIQILASHDEAN